MVCVCFNLLHIILVMCHKLHAYRSLHACLLPPDIQNLLPQSTSCGSIKSSEHYFDTPGNDGERTTADTCAVTGHQQAAVCSQAVHVVLYACFHVCLMDQLTLTTIDYTAVTLHVAIAMKV